MYLGTIDNIQRSRRFPQQPQDIGICLKYYRLFSTKSVCNLIIALLLLWCMGCASNGRHSISDDLLTGKTPFAQINTVDSESGDATNDQSQGAVSSASEKKADTQQPAPMPPQKRKNPFDFKQLASQSQTADNSGKKKTRDAKPEAETPVHVELAFDNADLYEVLDLTLFDLYGISYMVDPSIKTQVTFHFSGDYTRTEFIEVMNNVLQLSALSIVRGPGNIYKIVQKPVAPGAANDSGLTDDVQNLSGDTTRMFRLKYIGAPMAAASIVPFLSRGAVVVQDNVNNALIITDILDNLDKSATILGLMDSPFFQDITWQVFPIKAVDAVDLSKDLSQVLKSGGLFNRAGVTQGSVEVIPIQTMNALLVATRWPELLKLVEDWITAMDQVTSTGYQVFVYFVENGTAEELADILGQLYGKSPSSARSSSTRTTKKTSSTATRTTGKTPAQTIVPPVAAGTGDISSEIDIIADQANNALVIRATERDYRIIEKVLKQLDILPRQVLINVIIAEITLSGSVEYGVEWFLNKNIGALGGAKGDYTAQGTLDSGVSRAISTPLGSASGFSFALYDPVDFLRGLVTLLGSDSDVNILSSPNILALDNQEASIEVGKEIPTVTGTTSDATSGTSITSTVQYRKTGIILTVTPQINSSGLVKMELEQEVSDVGEYLTDLKNFTFLSRKIGTSLVVEDGKTIVIGGLMTSNQRNSNAGIPFLKDIPILGYLFGAGSTSIEKTELVLLITPRVIKTRSEADRITREFSDRVEALITEMGKK